MFRNVEAPVYTSVFLSFSCESSMSSFDSTPRCTLTKQKHQPRRNGARQSALPLIRGCLDIRFASDVAFPVSCFMLPGRQYPQTQPRGTLVLSSATSFLLAMSDIRPKISSLERIATELCILTSLDQHSGVWLQVVLLSSIGPVLDDETTGITVAQRLGLPVYEPTSAVVVEQFTPEVSISCPAASKAFVRRGFETYPESLPASSLLVSTGAMVSGQTVSPSSYNYSPIGNVFVVFLPYRPLLIQDHCSNDLGVIVDIRSYI